MSFSDLGLSDHIVTSTTAVGYSMPTEIQHKTIPAAIAGQDILGCAPTGTGKTAAFVLPILHNLRRMCAEQKRAGTPRALILAPTRELSQQIESAARSYSIGCGLRTVSVYGGVNIVRQLNELRRGVDILVATPGRLLDHVKRESINLSRIEVLVLDEADRMYDMGFIHDVRKIVSYLPPQRQTLLFSATMSREIRSLVGEIQNKPHQVNIGDPYSPVDTVEQRFYLAPTKTKNELLLHIVRTERPETMLVFSRTKHGADKIMRFLQRAGVKSAVIHSNRSQSQRQHALEGFKRRRYRILVATDIAARGIDVDKISHVVNFDTPVFAEDYIHRVGRTGRAQEHGVALTFVSHDEEKFKRRIEKLVGKRFPLKEYPDFSHPATQVPVSADSRPYARTKKAATGRPRRTGGGVSRERRAWTGQTGSR
ncbi:MAG: DEAD/DEAH box helicase [Chitinivibrionales bacterium]|nr:DEAD/DEAH box helicase [Chitinivibrionales bacterium]MBD3358396.1 DEAD/DEAH box helicase [Chitinivibrionales bacterium]